MSSQTSKKKKIGLSKEQVDGIILNVKDHLMQNTCDLRKKICGDLLCDPTMKAEGRQSIVNILMSEALLIDLCDCFCDIYSKCNIGVFKDRYSLMQIRWSEWISNCLVCGSAENIRIIPDSLSQRGAAVCESSDTSTVLHGIAALLLETICSFIKSLRPTEKNQAVASPISSKSDDLMLGFAGACMRLIYKKSGHQMKRLICNLQMSETMKDFYTSVHVFKPGTSIHRTIPVRGLHKYLKYINNCLNESCNEEALSLYKNNFVKVNISEISTLIKNYIFFY